MHKLLSATDYVAKNQKAVSTGLFCLDRTSGIKGFPVSSITEISGPSSTGKSTIALQLIKSAQEQGYLPFLLDSENVFNSKYAIKIGIKIDYLIVSQISILEHAQEIIIQMIRGGADYIVIDSAPALVPLHEFKTGMTANSTSLQSNLLANLLHSVSSEIVNKDVVVVIINQTRRKLNTPYHLSEITLCNKGFSMYASLRYKTIATYSETIGTTMTMTAYVNHVGCHSHKSCHMLLKHGEGIVVEADTLNECLTSGIVIKNGNWITYGQHLRVNGKNNAIQALKTNPRLHSHLKNELLQLYRYKK